MWRRELCQCSIDFTVDAHTVAGIIFVKTDNIRLLIENSGREYVLTCIRLVGTKR